MNNLSELFYRTFGVMPENIEKMPLSGSNREYYFLVADQTRCVGTIGKELKENQAFINFTKTFSDAGFNVPTILSVSDDQMSYLQSYIEGDSLFDILEKHRNSDGCPNNTVFDYYKRVIEVLPKFQVEGFKKIDFDKCYPRKCFDKTSLMWDFNYFKYYFLKTAHVFFDEQLLENDFNTLADYLCGVDNSFFMYRDFQSRNIIISHGEPYFIDYQGGRRGAAQYDIASLLYDGKAALPPETRLELLDLYIKKLNDIHHVNSEKFKRDFNGFALARIMQACGSYGYRGFFEKKTHFLASIAPAMKNLEYLLDNSMPDISINHLKQCLKQLINSDFLHSLTPSANVLTVRVESFSFRKGVPYDPSGNGGGFVFDCRAIHNPGRYEKYRTMCGKDQEVKEFFAKESDMDLFCNLINQTVDLAVEKYLLRGYKNLAVFTGCTGGQHRSVYCAESIANHLTTKFGNKIYVNLKHNEENNWPN